MFVTLLLAVAFPILCAAVFPIFVFLILPITPLVNAAGLSLYAYWLISAGTWLIALGVVLPQMRSEIPIESTYPADLEASYDLKKIKTRGSADDILDTAEPLKRSSEGGEESPRSSLSNEFQDHLLKGSKTGEEAKEKVVREERTALQQEADDRESLVEDGIVIEKVTTTTTKTTKYTETAISTTASAQDTYECSLPSPEPTSGNGKTKNTVFIFVNNGDEASPAEEKK